MNTNDLRLYFVISTSLPSVPSQSQWQSVFDQLADKPLYQVIQAAARMPVNGWTARKFAQGTGYVNKQVLGVFQIQRHATRREIRIPQRKQTLKQLYLAAGGTLSDGNIDDVTVLDAALQVLDHEAGLLSISGSNIVKFEAVMTDMLRQAALEAGFNAAQAATLTFTIIALGVPATAEAQAQQYLADNPAIWHQDIA